MRTTNGLTRLLLFTATTLMLLSAGGAPASAGGLCHEEQTDETTVLVELTGMCFRPTIVRVSTGATVEFVNRDPLAHNVVGHASAWGHFDSLSTGDSYSAAFDEAGVYPFTCTIHPGMVGAVVVGEGAHGTAGATTTRSIPWRPFAALAASAAFLAGVWRLSKPHDQVATNPHAAA